MGWISGLNFEVDPGSCCLGNYKVNIYVECCVQKPSSESVPGLEIKPASLCQGDLDPPGKSGMFILTDTCLNSKVFDIYDFR